MVLQPTAPGRFLASCPLFVVFRPFDFLRQRRQPALPSSPSSSIPLLSFSYANCRDVESSLLLTLTLSLSLTFSTSLVPSFCSSSVFFVIRSITLLFDPGIHAPLHSLDPRRLPRLTLSLQPTFTNLASIQSIISQASSASFLDSFHTYNF